MAAKEEAVAVLLAVLEPITFRRLAQMATMMPKAADRMEPLEASPTLAAAAAEVFLAALPVLAGPVTMEALEVRATSPETQPLAACLVAVAVALWAEIAAQVETGNASSALGNYESSRH